MASQTDDTAPADISNWRSSPHNQWAFRNIRQLMPTAPIRASGDVLELPEAPADLSGFRLPGPGGASLDLSGFMQATSGDGMVVLLDGEIVHEAYANGLDAHTPHILMSATKSIVGLVAGILKSQGELDLDAPVSDYVPEVTFTAYQGASLQQLIDMRGGVLLDEHDQKTYLAATNWDPITPGQEEIGLHSFYENMTSPPRPHGGPFSYVSANTDLLGWAMERATGETFADLVSRLLWAPIGAQDEAFITLDRHGAPRCTGGICATARDFARIGQVMVDGGQRAGAQVIPPAWIQDIATGGDHQAWATGEFARGFAGMTMRYRDGWYVIDDEPQTLFAMGIHGQNLFVDRKNRLVIAKVSSQNQPIDYRAVPLTHQAVNEIRRCLL